MIIPNISSNTRVIPIFGNPVKHSLSPVFQNFWLNKAKKDFVYLAFDISKKDLKQAIQSVKIFNMAGANITVPHKNEAMKYMDYIDKSAKIIGSVNTVVNKNGKLIGYNTDAIGLIADFKSKKINLKNKNIIVVGAGGASKAVLYALNKMQVKNIYLTSKTYKKAVSVSAGYKNVKTFDILKFPKDIFEKTDLIINASTCGMNNKDKLPFEIKKYKPGIMFYDLIYNKLTPFKKFALKNKLKYFSGEGMLICQGAASFRMWTKATPDINSAFLMIKKSLRQQH